MQDQPTILWKLQREREEVSCQVRLAPYGIEVDVARGGTVVLTRVFATDDEALAWANIKRAAREGHGWVPASAQTVTTPTRPS